MNLERIDYQIDDFKAMELYPYVTKTKRYFKAVNQSLPNQLFRIITYKKDFVKQQPLLEYLNSIKEVEMQCIGKIINIMESTELVRENNMNQKQKIIAVVLEEKENSNFIIFYDFAMELAPLKEILVKDFTVKLLELIRVLNQRHFSNWIYPDDIYIQRKTGQIRIDCFGDRKFFKTEHEQYISDLWELGYFAFTCLKTFPPYTKKSLSDPHFTCLSKENHSKFWLKVKRKQEDNANFVSFINFLFSTKEISLPDLHEEPWLKGYEQMNLQQKTNHIKETQQQKIDLKAKKEEQRRKKSEKIRKAVAQRNMTNTNRGKLNDTFLESFHDHLDKLETNEHQFCALDKEKPETTFVTFQNEDPNVVFAFILSTLRSINDENVEITEVKDKGNKVSFRIKAELSEEIEVNTEGQIIFVKGKDVTELVLNKVGGSFFEGLWVRNYLCQILSLL